MRGTKAGTKPRSALQHEVSIRNWRRGRVASIQNQLLQLCRELDYNAALAFKVSSELYAAIESKYKGRVNDIKLARDNQIK